MIETAAMDDYWAAPGQQDGRADNDDVADDIDSLGPHCLPPYHHHYRRRVRVRIPVVLPVPMRPGCCGVRSANTTRARRFARSRRRRCVGGNSRASILRPAEENGDTTALVLLLLLDQWRTN